MDKYVIIVTQNSWGDQSSVVYITEAENAKESIIAVIRTYPDDRFDSIDIDSAISNYTSNGIINGFIILKRMSFSDSDTVEFKSYKIYDNEPTVRILR